MKSYSVKYETAKQLETFVKQLGIIDFDQVLVQIYTGFCDKDYIRSMMAEVNSVLGDAHIIGSTSGGEIFHGDTIDGVTMILISVFENTSISTSIASFTDETIYDVAKRTSQQLINKTTKVQIVFASGNNLYGDNLLEGIHGISPELIVSGGYAGHLDLADPTYVFSNKEIVNNGLVIASLSSEVLEVYPDSSFSWVPIGREYIVTKSAENRIIEVEGVPVKTFYEKHIGFKIEDIPDVFLQFPFVVRKYGKDIPCPIFGVVDGEQFMVGTNILPGESIRLGYGNLVDILNGTKAMLRHLTSIPIESIFIYSCSGRRAMLKDHVVYEIRPLNKDISINGFYTGGEFNHIGSRNVLYMETLTLLALSENTNARIEIDETVFEEGQFFKDTEEAILHNLMMTTGTELNELNKELEQIVENKTEELRMTYLRDVVTGLYNMNKLVDDIDLGTYNKLAIIKVNNFSDVNIYFGQHVSNNFLFRIGQLLTGYIVNEDFMVYKGESGRYYIGAGAKISSEVFIDYITKAQNWIQKNYVTIDDNRFYVDSTSAIVVEESHLIEKASSLINDAKASRVSQLIYSDDLDLISKIENNLQMVNKIRSAIAEDRILPYYQGIRDNRTGEISKYEALMRLIDEDGSVLTPFFFLEIARRSGLYRELTKIMIHKTFKKFENLDYTFSINLLYSDLVNLETKEIICNYLNDPSYKGRVIIEIVEDEGIKDLEMVTAFIECIKKRGAKIAIDDFGSGYSNYKYLTEINVDYMKIDGSLIKNLDKDQNANTVVESIVTTGKRLGMEIIAEFVHSKSIQDIIEKLEVEYTQGYYYSEPSEKLLSDL